MLTDRQTDGQTNWRLGVMTGYEYAISMHVLIIPVAGFGVTELEFKAQWSKLEADLDICRPDAVVRCVVARLIFVNCRAS